MQKKHEDYKNMKDDTVWSMEKMNQYVNEHFAEEKGIAQDWVLTTLEVRDSQIIQSESLLHHPIEFDISKFQKNVFRWLLFRNKLSP